VCRSCRPRGLKDDGPRRRKIGRAGLAGYVLCWRHCNVDTWKDRKLKSRGRRNSDKRSKTELHAQRSLAVVGRRTAIAIAYGSVSHRWGGHRKGHARHTRRMRNRARSKHHEQNDREDAGKSVHRLMLACFRLKSSYRLSQPTMLGDSVVREYIESLLMGFIASSG
jgi:hypothetical protein